MFQIREKSTEDKKFMSPDKGKPARISNQYPQIRENLM